jgi:pyruvate dehydrogenase (quinone)
MAVTAADVLMGALYDWGVEVIFGLPGDGIVEVGLVGDNRRSLNALLPLLKGNEDGTFLEQARAGMQEWWKLIEEQGTRRDKPMKPEVVAWELGQRLSDRVIVAADSGTITAW